MATCTELDTRPKDLYHNYKQVLYGTARLDLKEFIDTCRNQELVGLLMTYTISWCRRGLIVPTTH